MCRLPKLLMRHNFNYPEVSTILWVEHLWSLFGDETFRERPSRLTFQKKPGPFRTWIYQHQFQIKPQQCSLICRRNRQLSKHKFRLPARESSSYQHAPVFMAVSFMLSKYETTNRRNPKWMLKMNKQTANYGRIFVRLTIRLLFSGSWVGYFGIDNVGWRGFAS